MRKIMAAVVAVVLVVSACTPTTTISASAPRYVRCDDGLDIIGTVDPPNAMTSVVIQRTQNGKWVDWMANISGDWSEPGQKVIGRVQRDGTWIAQAYVDFRPDVTYHLRARASAAAGGTKIVSKSFYVTTTRPAIGCPVY